MPPSLLIVDGNNLFYRAFYALPRLTAPDGTPTGAVFGFARMLAKVIDSFSPTHVAVVFDAPGRTFRDEMFEAYKETRQKMPEEMSLQLPLVKELVRRAGLALLEVEGVEADDVIATLATRGKEEGLSVIIVSSDKDLCQLVGDGVVLFDSLKDRVIDADYVREKYGVPPERIVDLIALAGDQSDNIPGVPGIGDKTAASLLREYGSLDGLLKNAEFIKGKRGQLIRDHVEEISLSRDLARVRRDLDLPVDLKDLSPAEKDAAGLREMFRKLGFTVPLFGISPRERGEEEGGAQEVKVLPVTAARDLESFLDEAGERVGIFCGEDKLVVSSEQGAVSVPGELSSSLGPLLKGRGKSVVFYDAKEAARRNPSLKPLLKGSFEDVMVMAYIASPEESSFALDRLVTKYLGSSVDPGGEAAGAFLLPLFRELKETLSREGLENLYREVDLPLVPVLLTMEERGIILRREALERLSREIEGELGNIEREIREIAGEEVNLASPKQVSFLLFEKLGLPPVKRTKTGYSTDISVLEELSPLHEVPRLIIRHRMLAKLKSTYVDVLPGLVDPRTGRIHTSFHQTTTATGRLSSSNPNLQNIPIRTEEGRKIRDAFVAEEGYFFLGADYSQIELRVLAHLSGDETLKEIFHEGRDVHTETAVALFGVGKGEVTPEMRRQAKVVNFGIIYGMSPYGLSRELKIGQKEAREYIESYFSRYPGVREFIDETIEKAKETGYVETLFGRKRRLPDLSSRNQNLRQAAERMAINTPVQGTAADIIKLSMIRLHHRLLERGLDAHLVLQIHDELVLEVREESLEEAKEILRDSMENVVELSVPLTVDLKWGRTWGEI